tara:strand:+ start:173 stop:916 length:744 start_codon:yes stop_codon:yes gene_type:complete
MKINKFINEFNTKGYFKVTQFINQNMIDKIIDEIKIITNITIYKDRKNQVRRLEQFYNKGLNLNKLNLKCCEFIKNTINKEVVIFKDKLNTKPSGGEGFSAHYDGVFRFKDANSKLQNGWYYYGDFFVNILLALDECTEQNGTIEIANSHDGDFNQLLKNTTNDGTPNLLSEVERKTSFEKIILQPGDIVIFKSTCPHRSKKNTSSTDRKVLYYTYSDISNGSQYTNYFNDKKNSKNETEKSLTGNL